MRYASVFFVFFILLSLRLQAQSNRNEVITYISNTNQKIDQAITEKDIITLRKLYANDFVFTHGGGKVDSKESWIKNVENPDIQFVSRVHDSVNVELHGSVAIVTGKLSITRLTKEVKVMYTIHYVRVFEFRKRKWQIISHRTISEIIM